MYPWCFRCVKVWTTAARELGSFRPFRCLQFPSCRGWGRYAHEVSSFIASATTSPDMGIPGEVAPQRYRGWPGHHETSLQCQAIFAALNNRCQRQNLEVPFGICGEVSQSFVRRFVRDPCAPQNGMVLEQREARLRSESVSAVVVVFGVALEVAPLPFPPTGALRFGHLGRRLSSPNPPYEQAPDLPRQVTAPDPSLEAICCRPAGRCWPPRSVIPSGWCSSRKTDWGPCRTV